MTTFEEKTVIITGGIGILGKTFCQAFAERGAQVVIVDINKKEVEEYGSYLSKEYGTKSLGISCDITQAESVLSMVESVLDRFGKIDILHNNAATKTNNLNKYFESFENYSLNTWQDVMAVNINGMFLVAQAVGRQMVKQNNGSIIQMSSIYGMLAPDNRIYKDAKYMGCQINTPAVYSVSKAAVLGLTKYLATYWADKNIRVNCITPGGIESGQNNDFVKNYSNRVPMNRMGRSNELVGALLFLASDASSYITGQNIVIDGGLSVW